jgi:hypothetical protein
MSEEWTSKGYDEEVRSVCDEILRDLSQISYYFYHQIAQKIAKGLKLSNCGLEA